MGDEVIRETRDPRRDKQNRLEKDHRPVDASPSLVRSGLSKIKAHAHRDERHAAKQDLAALDITSEEAVDEVTGKLSRPAPHDIEKPAALPLNEVIEQKQSAREDPDAAWETRLHG